MFFRLHLLVSHHQSTTTIAAADCNRVALRWLFIEKNSFTRANGGGRGGSFRIVCLGQALQVQESSFWRALHKLLIVIIIIIVIEKKHPSAARHSLVTNKQHHHHQPW